MLSRKFRSQSKAKMQKEVNTVVCICNYEAGGNASTMARIKSYLENSGMRCIPVNSQTVDTALWRSQEELGIRGVIAIHAFHCATVLMECRYPFALIFGGTDLNDYSGRSDYFEKMMHVVLKARKLVTFSSSMTRKVTDLWPGLDLHSKIKEIPQAVKSGPSSFNIKWYLKHSRGIEADNVFLLVSGIRPVKDPLFLVPAFSEWHRKNNSCWLVVVGTIRDADYCKLVREKIHTSDGVVLLPQMPQCDVHACIKDSVALVNSSISEGMCSAILESMDLGTPVIARNIPGNQDIIVNGKTGLLYDTPEEFVKLAKLVLENKTLRQELARAAKERILEKHQCQQEAGDYVALVKSLSS